MAQVVDADELAGRGSNPMFDKDGKPSGDVEAGRRSEDKDEGIRGKLEDITGLIGDNAKETMEQAKVWWNYWGCYLFTYFALPIILVGTFFGASAQMKIVQVNNFTAPGVPGVCEDLYVYSTLSRGWKVWLSIVPIIIVFAGILLMNKSSKTVAPFAMVVTAVLCVLYFHDEGASATLDTVPTAGLILLTVVDRTIWTVFEYAYNVFAAFVFLRVIQLWGLVAVMKQEFEILAYDVDRKVLLIMFNFAIIVAVVAPGGSNFLIAGTILMEMNLMNLPDGAEKDKYDLRIGAISLFGNAITSSFNLVGVCIIAIAGDIISIADDNNANYPCSKGDEKCAQKQIGFHFSAQLFLGCMACPFIFIWLYTRNITSKHFLKRNFVLCLGCGFFFSLAQVITAYYIGPELPCLTSAGASTIFYIVYVTKIEPWYDAKFERQKSFVGLEAYAAEERAEAERQLSYYERFAWVLPFIMLCALLMITNLIPPIVWSFQGGDDPIAQQALDVFLLSTRTRCRNFVQRWAWFIHSGTMVMYCALATPFLCPFNSNEENQKLLELVDLNAGNMMAGSAEGLGEDVKSPGMVRLERAQSVNKLAMREMVKLAKNLGLSFWQRYRIVMKRALIDGLEEAIPVTIAIASFASLARIMSGFGMTRVLSTALVDLTRNNPPSFGIISSLLGALGAGLTGSTTTSNFLFGRLQVQTALDLGLVVGGPYRVGSLWSVAGCQIMGSSAGEAIAPQNAIFAAIILRGRFTDGQIIKGVLPVTFFTWLLMCMLTGLVAVGFAQPLY